MVRGVNKRNKAKKKYLAHVVDLYDNDVYVPTRLVVTTEEHNYNRICFLQA